MLAVNHPFNDPSRPVIQQGIIARGIVVEDGAWIGAGAILLDGVRVGAGPAVTGDVPPRTLAVGVPAHVVWRLDTGNEMQTQIFEAVRGETSLSRAAVADCGREI